MKKRTVTFISLLLTFLYFTPAIAQEEEDKPIRPPFETTLLIDNQTTVNPYQGALGLEIQHRFSPISSISDLFGIYGSANTRMALSYGVTDKLMIGLGTTRNYKLQDLEWKYSILTQTRSGKIPVSVSYAGNMVIDARNNEVFGAEEDFKSIHRLSYMNQVIVSRKIGMLFSAQVAPTFIWMNAVEEGYNNLNFSVNTGLRAMVLGFHSIILEYEQPITQPEDADVYPNLALGVEIGTSTHSFRVFAANYNAMVKNYNVVYNNNNPFDMDYQFGFNISINF
ncbi:MAG TPA: DUF5777 family beta-barrel protein [Bacteroidales bacterium]|nr:DUF5777 family beta-barrel protein [Bacteroidales bacterium]